MADPAVPPNARCAELGIAAIPNSAHFAGRAVVVVGLRAEAVAERVVELRRAGRRASGFVGDDLPAAEAMAAELFGADVDLETL